MKEIEVKAKLKNKNSFIEKLKSLGELSSLIIQVDSVYVKEIGDIDTYINNHHFVRIRETSDGKYILTIKKPMKESLLAKIEHETEIQNHKEMEQALFLMGYTLSNTVKKTRQFLHHKECEICIDDVESLGSFVEVEKFSEDDPNLVRKELFDFLISMGVSKEDEVHEGYDILMLRSNSKDSK